MQIREARPQEYERIGALTFAAYAALGESTYLGWYGERLRDVAGRAADAVVLVAVDDVGEVLGSVTYVPGPDSSMADFTDPTAAGMRMLAVGAHAQGSGAGRALVDEVVRRARAAGKERIVIHTTDFMPAARRLYLTTGFERDESLDARPDPSTSILGFRLELGGP